MLQLTSLQIGILISEYSRLCSEQLTEVLLGAIPLIRPNRSLLSEPAVNGLINNTSIVLSVT